jgi:Nucleotidyltransferase domain
VRRVRSSRSTRTGARAATSAEAALWFAQTLARACAGALGEAVAGVILHGSLTLDDYLPGRSDIDLLVVAQDPLTDAQLAALTEALAGHRPRAPGPVDLRLVTRQVAASPTLAPPIEAYLRLTPSSGVRVEERRHPGERDLAVELSVCRAHGRSLGGAASSPRQPPPPTPSATCSCSASPRPISPSSGGAAGRWRAPAATAPASPAS